MSDLLKDRKDCCLPEATHVSEDVGAVLAEGITAADVDHLQRRKDPCQFGKTTAGRLLECRQGGSDRLVRYFLVRPPLPAGVSSAAKGRVRILLNSQ